MRKPLRMRPLTAEEERVIKKLAHSHTASARLVERAQIIELAAQGQTIPQIIHHLALSEPTVRKWWKRFESMGISGLEDSERLGAPPHVSAEQKAKVLEVALTDPKNLEVGFTCWTFERLAVYVQEQ